MKREKWNKYGLSAVVTLAVLAVIYMIQLNFGDYLAQIWDAFKSVAIPAALALFVSYLIRPMYRAMYKKGISKTLAALLSMLIFVIITGGFITLIVVLISSQVNEIIGTGWSIVEVNLDWLFNMMPPEMVAGITNDLGQLDVSKAFEYLTSTGEIVL